MTHCKRNRGIKSYVQGIGSVRQHRRRHTGEYAYLRGRVIGTPDGDGTVLGDSNKFSGSRKLVVRLLDGRVRHYSYYEVSYLNNNLWMMVLTSEKKWGNFWA